MRTLLQMSLYAWALYVAVNVDTVAQSNKDPWPTHYDAIAVVHVRSMEHELLSSDVRRIEHGAPMPFVPYSARLDIQKVYPELKTRRILLEGIVNSAWMPEEGSLGIIALRKQGVEYTPAATFPLSGYLSLQTINGKDCVAFPPGSESYAPSDLAWQCFCDLLDLQPGGASDDVITRWNSILLTESAPSALLAFFYMLNAAPDKLDWGAVYGRMSNAHPNSQHVDPLPSCEIIRLVANYAGDNYVEQLFPGMLDWATHLSPSDADCIASEILRITMRLPREKRMQALNDLFLIEYGQGSAATRLIHSFKQIEPVLTLSEDDHANALLSSMLTESWRFPCIKSREDVELLWQLMAQRKHPALKPYLTEFIKQPTPEFLKMPMNPLDIEQLISKAQMFNTKNVTSELP